MFDRRSNSFSDFIFLVLVFTIVTFIFIPSISPLTFLLNSSSNNAISSMPVGAEVTQYPMQISPKLIISPDALQQLTTEICDYDFKIRSVDAIYKNKSMAEMKKAEYQKAMDAKISLYNTYSITNFTGCGN